MDNTDRIDEIKTLPEYQEILDRADYIRRYGTVFE